MKNEQIQEILHSVHKILNQNDNEIIFVNKLDYKTYLGLSRDKFLQLKYDLQNSVKVKGLSDNFISNSLIKYLSSAFPNYEIAGYNKLITEINKVTKKRFNVLLKLYNIDIQNDKLIHSTFEMYKPSCFIKENPDSFLYLNINEKNRINSDNALHVILILKDVEVFHEDLSSTKLIIEQAVTNFMCFLFVILGDKTLAQSISTKFSHINDGYSLINDDYKIFSSSLISESTYVKPNCKLLDDNLLINNKLLLDLLKEQNSKIKKKLYNSILWLGKSLITKNLSDSFLQVAIAFECLLSRQEQGYFIQPSITVSLSECLAFLIGNNAKSRKSYFRTLKSLYSKRSSIVHSGNICIDIEDYYKFFEYVKKGIYAILELVCKNKYETIDDIYDYVDFIKFS